MAASSGDSHAHASPLGRVLGALAAIERHELPSVVAAFTLFFCVFGGYFAVRPVRETVGTLVGPDRVADLWTWTWLGSIAVVPVYGLAVARVRRSVFLPWMYGSVAASLVFVGLALDVNAISLAAGQFFYVFISVLSLLLPSVFWSFLVEFYSSGQAKRLFPVIFAGGTAGALAGPVFTDITVRLIGNRGVLFVGATLFVAAIVCQRILLAIWMATDRSATAGAPPANDRALGGNPLAGLGLVLRSPYLLSIALFVTLLASVSTFLYFEQLRLVELTYPDPAQRTRFFARIDWVVQSLTIVSQLFITSRIASRVGLTVLLGMVPVAMIFGFVILAVWNTFQVFVVVFVLRRAGEYAFVRPGREILWSPLDRESKYKAKNLVDVPIYRGADALAAQLERAIGNAGFGPQAIAAIGAVTAAAWTLNAVWLGRRGDAATASPASSVSPAPPHPIEARP